MHPVSSSRGQRRKGIQAAGSPGPGDNTEQMGKGMREERKEDPGEGIWGLRSFKRERMECGSQIHSEADSGEDREGMVGLGPLEVTGTWECRERWGDVKKGGQCGAPRAVL